MKITRRVEAQRPPSRWQPLEAVPDGLNFLTPPACAGKIIERSYSGDEDGVYRRTVDYHDGSTRYEWRERRDDDDTPVGLNVEPR
jgi:hypothetical protein